MSEKMLSMYFRLRDGLFFAFPTSKDVQIRTQNWKESLVWFRQVEGEQWLSDLFRSMDGSRTLGELLNDLPSNQRENGLKITLTLRDKGFLVESDCPFMSLDGLPPIWSHLFGLRRMDLKWLEEAMKQVRVLVIGAGMVGSRVAVSLAQSGIRAMTLVDHEKVGKEDKSTSPVFLSVPLGKSRAHALAEVVQQMNSSLQVEVKHVSKDERDTLLPKLYHHDIVLVVKDMFSPSWYQWVNEHALKMDLRWSMVLVDGWDVFVGPTYFPGQTGCYQCLETKRLEGMRNPESYIRFREGITSGMSTSSVLCTPAFADLAAGLLVADFPNWVGMVPQRIEQGTGLTLGRQLHLNLKTFDANFHPIIRNPNCPICGSLSTSYPAVSNPE